MPDSSFNCILIRREGIPNRMPAIDKSNTSKMDFEEANGYRSGAERR